MARHWKIAIAILAVFLVIGLLTFPGLLRNVLRLKRASETEQQAQREIAQQPISTPTDTREKASLFWISADSPDQIAPTEMELPLSADPLERAKQLIVALIAQAPSDARRTLPADAELLQFYLLDDGSAVADFSESLGTKTPSGILNEQMAVDSIVRTLGANLTTIHRLKILIHGQEADTLAGHLDLSGFFLVMPLAAASPSADTTPAALPAAPSSGTPAAAPATPAALPAPPASTSPSASPPATPAGAH